MPPKMKFISILLLVKTYRQAGTNSGDKKSF